MTATVPQQGPPTRGGSTAARRYGAVYAYTVLDHVTGLPVPDDYVGQSRTPQRRDLQHRGLAPQRDGRFREQPWADLIVGTYRLVEDGQYTDDELDAAELRWMGTLAPRLNCKDSTTADRIPIYVQRRQRDARDIAKGLQARDWNAEHGPGLNRPAPVPGQSRAGLWTRLWATRAGRRLSAWLHRAATVAAWWAVLTTALTVGLAVWGRLPLQDAVGTAAVVVAVLLGGALYLFRPRRGGRTNRRRRT